MQKRYKLKNYSLVYPPKWKIEGFDHYYFTSDKKLFNTKTNRFSKQVVRNYSRGYNLDGKFYVLSKMKSITKLVGKVSNNHNFKSVTNLYNYLKIAA